MRYDPSGRRQELTEIAAIAGRIGHGLQRHVETVELSNEAGFAVLLGFVALPPELEAAATWPAREELSHRLSLTRQLVCAIDAVARRDVADPYLCQVVENGVGQGELEVMVVREQSDDKERDTPAVGGHRLRGVDPLADPASAGDVLELNGLQEAVDKARDDRRFRRVIHRRAWTQQQQDASLLSQRSLVGVVLGQQPARHGVA